MSLDNRITVCAGLGNPGKPYDGTRHNVGFALVDALAEESGWQVRDDLASSEVQLAAGKLILLKPLSFMNCSGEPLQRFLAYRNIAVTSLLVVHDEVDLPAGSLRLRFGGGTGGHNGLNSIVSRMGSEFYRVRLGVGRPTDASDMRNWVLGRFAPDDRQLVDTMLHRAKEAIAVLLSEGLARAQNRFHRTEEPPAG